MTRTATLLLMATISFEAGASEVPTELFGITLGMTATRTAEDPRGSLPVKRLTGIASTARGARYYYEPLETSEQFPLIEYRQGDEPTYNTNYSSLVLPAIPDEFSYQEWLEDAKKNGQKIRIMSVEFTSDVYDSSAAAYEAASKYCEDASRDLEMQPSEEEDINAPWSDKYSRICKFAQDERIFSIEQFGPKVLHRLVYNEAYVQDAISAVLAKVNPVEPEAADEPDRD